MPCSVARVREEEEKKRVLPDMVVFALMTDVERRTLRHAALRSGQAEEAQEPLLSSDTTILDVS